ncbi:MAG TPA: helix-turn-helix domain-containing protein [Mucilaginibacter sp.]|nr:helix-turn-helix domain-containing protein [Mucilaginibacter sp.]
MKLTNLNFNDNELSQFARALALPVRVFIVRTIIENGFSINRDALYTTSFNIETINKHVSELRSLGLIKANGVKGNITYSIEQSWFEQMSIRFSSLFESINRFNPGSVDVNTHVDTPAFVSKKEKDDLPNFGAYIKKQRLELNISQEDLAKKIKIDRAQLSRIECGKNQLNADKLKALSQALYLNTDVLTKEYYSYRLAELIEESGYKEMILNSAKEKLNNLFSL